MAEDKNAAVQRGVQWFLPMDSILQQMHTDARHILPLAVLAVQKKSRTAKGFFHA